MIRVLHTSDWHLGRSLHDVERNDEYDFFLQWLLKTIESEKIDVLLIAGDVFDTSNPQYSAQQKYYDFCTKLSKTCCRHAVVTSGNHDSSVFIDVPAQVLACLNIHVVGQAKFCINRNGNPADEVIVLKNAQGKDELIVAAVPFLSDKDVRLSSDGEGTESKEQKVLSGIAEHYARVAQETEIIRADRDIPVVAMGHLYVKGGKIGEDDARERMTYVGNLGGVDVSIFGNTFDYVALGHLHVPQCVAGYEHIRYSGSPLVMGFGEAGQKKNVCLIDFDGKNKKISTLEIPQLYQIERLIGDKSEIENKVNKIISDDVITYISVTYNGEAYIENLREWIWGILDGNEKIKCLEIQDKCKNKPINPAQFSPVQSMTLKELDEMSVFNLLLDIQCANMTQDEKQVLVDTYKELVIQAKSE